MPEPSFRYILREDYRTNKGCGWLAMALLASYRMGARLTERRRRTRARLTRAFFLPPLWIVNQIHSALSHSFGCYVPFTAKIGLRPEFRHSLYGIFISQAAVIGDDVLIFHHVTVGSNNDTSTNPGAPTIGNGVLIGAGAMLIGRIAIGDGVRIGANTVVVENVPAGCTVVSQPSRVIPPKSTVGAEPI